MVIPILMIEAPAYEIGVRLVNGEYRRGCVRKSVRAHYFLPPYGARRRLVIRTKLKESEWEEERRRLITRVNRRYLMEKMITLELTRQEVAALLVAYRTYLGASHEDGQEVYRRAGETEPSLDASLGLMNRLAMELGLEELLR